jgi:hypothetical protein
MVATHVRGRQWPKRRLRVDALRRTVKERKNGVWHLSCMRVVANGLEPRLRGGVADVARRLCGVQAQDAAAARLAIRARTEGLTAADVDAEPGVVRTWGWRGTLHLLAREDVPWVLSLVADRENRAVAARWRALELDDQLYARARAAIVERLAGGPATRAELREVLAAAGVDASGQRLPHLVRRAAFEGLLQHPLDGTFAALEPAGEPPPREQALGELARRHAAGYGPATPDDVAAFSGLPRGQILQSSKPDSGAREAAPESGAARLQDLTPGWVRLLGAFDPFLLGYRGYGHVVSDAHVRKVWPGGGWIYPVVLVDGVAAGTWRIDGSRVVVEAFEGAEVPELALEAEVQDVGRFLGRELAV